MLRLIAASIILSQLIVAGPLLTIVPPDGGLSGAPGSVVGWGFTLTNDAGFLVVTNSFFQADPASPNLIGQYTDIVSSSFVVVGPGSLAQPSLSQPFDNGAGTGLGGFIIYPFAVVGNSTAGNIVVNYDLFSVSPNDPNFDPELHTVSTGQALLTRAKVTVVSDVPEPSFQLPVGIVLCISGLRFWRSRRGFNKEEL